MTAEFGRVLHGFVLACLSGLPAAIASAAAPECTARPIPEAKFGAHDILSRIACPGIAPADEQSCRIFDAGLEYGVSEGAIVHKAASAETYAKEPGYRGTMPFGLQWGVTLASAAPKVKAVTGGAPAFHTDRRDETTVFFSEHYCLRANSGGQYALELWFDDKKGLYRIEERTQGP